MDNIDQHIHSLLVKKVTGTISKHDDIDIDQLIHTNDVIKQAWQELQQLHKSRGKAFSSQLNEDDAWDKIVQKIQPEPVFRSMVLTKWIATAAAILVITAGGIYFWHTLQPAKTGFTKQLALNKSNSIELILGNGKKIDLSHQQNHTVSTGQTKLSIAANRLSYSNIENNDTQWNVLNVPPVKDYQITLSDGTEVWLNSSSSLKFPFAFPGKLREVYLSGEAYFHVAKNAQQPFIVHTEKADIQVLGTSFNVNSYDQEAVSTSLVEGSVKMSSGKQNITLKPGFQGIYKETGVFLQERFDAESVLSWQQGVTYFHEARLETIARIIPRWFDIKVVFDRSTLKDKPFTGAIDKYKPISIFLSNLETSSGITTYTENGVLHLK